MYFTLVYIAIVVPVFIWNKNTGHTYIVKKHYQYFQIFYTNLTNLTDQKRENSIDHGPSLELLVGGISES